MMRASRADERGLVGGNRTGKSFLISHDIHDFLGLADRISVTLQGKLVGTVNRADVTTDEVWLLAS